MAGPDPLVTLTHARLRAARGDVRGAERLLEILLERDPEDLAAAELLRALARRGAVQEPEGLDRESPRESIRRLERWLHLIVS